MSFSIDTRTLKKGDTFVALKGPNFDGHDFVKLAEAKGAIKAIVSRDIEEIEIPLNIVPDTLIELQNIARRTRKNSRVKLIGVTGSAGKTTVKEMLKIMLSKFGKVYCNPGNYNNHIGMPFSIANMPEDTEFAILEMGMNHAGEIDFLSEILCPDISIITNVGPVHIENFDSVNDIAYAKSEVFKYTNECAVLNSNSQCFDTMLEESQHLQRIVVGDDVRCLSYENKGDAIQVQSEIFGRALSYCINSRNVDFIEDSLLALAVVHFLNLDVTIAMHSLQLLSPVSGRGNVIDINGLRIIDESYNANPLSMKSALRYMYDIDGRRILVLGDMLELGSKSKMLHEELLPDVNADTVFLIGDNMLYLYNILDIDEKFHFYSLKDLETRLLSYMKVGDTIMIKGSYSMGLKKIVSSLSI